ncbi:OFA family MFS transporter [Facklamia sp. DSM 111018]|uniref:OFA family MFS transporter n=1 Tax=Facklamia lactis TaxID=2749967 RepID=A0ABS0LP34_9LACT|nr:OFA family MFS transporter [Facklamia lactis]MBG9979521.1 OFA family MFS transporter [Facklamia lactis]MBG9985809.1 OFA family MFS transporter [Facklamia lactis]
MEKKVNRWIILLAAIITNLCLGAGYAWSVFQAALLEANPAWAQTQTAIAYSISFAMVPIGMIIFGPKLDQFGPRRFVFLGGILFGLGMFLTGFVNSVLMLYITYGLILGLGIGAAYGAATSVASKWFPDKKGLAGGLTAAGFGLGPLIFAPVVKWMLQTQDIYSIFRILGIILLVVICLASILMSKAPETETSSGQTLVEGKDYKEMIKENKFWLLWFVYTLGATGGMMIISSAASIASNYQLGDPVAVVMAVSIANTVGRIFWGSVSDKLGRYTTVIAMFLVVAGGLFLAISSGKMGALAGTIGLMMVGLSFGGFLGSFPGITAENWGVKNVGTNYGWMFTAYGVAAVFGPMIGSMILDATGSYSTAFIIVIGMTLVGILLQLYYMKKYKNG